ncbi:hypothetical protein ASF66_00810 [Pseudomonas sp. Leaf129]|uniref:DUF1382 family protein n=1 Tax=Pseudomonas sp. Leaf129 TaxID=1736268 RepID=UPI00070389C5|nr:DUF1382 family protein [Pseudomonas sp. Leaf129]KQQ62926.1 hypothetical protein ASF66_00810 [Pseudomonas sp. Leaf129]
MKRANPADLRRAAVVAHTYVKAGILFVPMPALDQADHDALVAQSADRLERLAQAAEQEQS